MKDTFEKVMDSYLEEGTDRTKMTGNFIICILQHRLMIGMIK
jgi:hypothetical protein